ncbi:PLP-dependent transferase [Microstroma glucosiphilum]|uniref:PLP-dependent transferase n=1 Tax=Pseudomicrostroma glucosiphilum TaxID=1684307 RepID=A0A316UDB9_9BASI|nr:PLP-dependent transferase [Pseudomicrostroma glucosiphilum]PWN22878.1 PLP-dependent transferase [Pseudomicrostroma glucosiphilum]
MPSTSAASTSQQKLPDYTRFLSAIVKLRPDSPIRALFPAEAIPGMLSLLAGKPNASTFPFESVSLQLKPAPGSSQGEKLVIQGEDLNSALQYGNTSGIPRFNKTLVDIQSSVHRRPIVYSTQTNAAGEEIKVPDWAISLGVGSQDLLSKTLECLLNPGDSVLVEDPVYAGVLPCMVSLQANVVPVASDDQGVTPQRLRQILSQWSTDPATSSKPFPKCLYTTPTGANPSGTSASEERKRQILSVVREFDILLLEDDAYFYLNFQGLGEDAVTRTRQKSYFHLDAEDTSKHASGRVLRFDSFSKILSGGMRLGFMTAHPTFISAVDKTTSSSNLQTPGLTQAVVLSILEHWGLHGFLQHCDRVATFYKERRDVFEGTAQRIIGTNGGKQTAIAKWVTPTAGMFLWLKLRLPPSTEGADDEGDSYPVIFEKAKKAGVLAVPGVAFMAGGKTTCYVRTSFSIVDEADFEEAFRRLRGVVEQAWTERGLSLPA